MRAKSTTTEVTPLRPVQRHDHLGVIVVVTKPEGVSSFVRELLEVLPEEHTLLLVNGVGKELAGHVNDIRDNVRIIRAPGTFSERGGWRFGAIAAGLRWHAIAGGATSVLALSEDAQIPSAAALAKGLALVGAEPSCGVVNLVAPTLTVDAADTAVRRAARFGSLKQPQGRAQLRRVMDRAVTVGGRRPFEAVGPSWIMGGPALSGLISQAMIDHDGLETTNAPEACLIALVVRAVGYSTNTLTLDRIQTPNLTSEQASTNAANSASQEDSEAVADRVGEVQSTETETTQAGRRTKTTSAPRQLSLASVEHQAVSADDLTPSMSEPAEDGHLRTHVEHVTKTAKVSAANRADESRSTAPKPQPKIWRFHDGQVMPQPASLNDDERDAGMVADAHH